MDETTTPPAQPAPAPSRPPRLKRHPTDKVVAGVAGGLGHYFGIDPIVFRLAFVGFTILGGGGVLLYLIAWIAMPVGQPGEPAARREGGDIAPWLGLGLVVVALLLLGGMLFEWRPPLVAALILLACGVLLFQHSDQRRVVGPLSGVDVAVAGGAPPPPPAGGPLAAPETTVVGQSGWDAGPRVRRRSRLGRLTIALVLLAVGILGMLDASDAIDVHPADYAAVALGIVGLGLIVGAWWGRARWLIVVGLLLLPCVAAAAIGPGTSMMRGPRGDVLIQPRSADELRADYEYGAGDLTLDLRGVVVPRGTERRVSARLGMGQLRVIVRPGTNVVAHGEAGVGRVRVFAIESGGLRPALQAEQPGPGGTLVLELHVGVGEIVVGPPRLLPAPHFFDPMPPNPMRHRPFDLEVF